MITVKSHITRFSILIAGLVVIFGIYYLIRNQYIQGAVITDGMVTGNYIHGINKSDFGSTISAEIKFILGDSLVTFLGPEGQMMEKGTFVPVIYRPEDPENARIYTFSGFWLNGLLWCLLPTIFWIAVSLSVIQVRPNST